MSDYSEFFLNSSADIIQYECIELSHPNFTQIYRIVRNNAYGLTVTLETTDVVTFDYYPLRITPSETTDNLDFNFQIEFGDTGEVIPNEIEAVIAADGFATKPTLKYRTYRSDDLSAPLVGPLVLEIQQFAINKTGCIFEAKAPSANINSTGKRYSIDKFPSLRFFL